MKMTSRFAAQAVRTLCVSLFAATLVACGGGEKTSSNGQTNDISATVTVSGSSGAAPMTVTFTAANLKGPIASYEWDFKDNTPVGNGQTIDHTFMEAGSYDVTLTVRDAAGRFNRANAMVTVSGDRIGNPVAGQFWNSVTFASDRKVLQRAAILFAGRIPTDAEEAAVVSGGTPVLRQTIRSYMQGPAFNAFLDEAGATWFFTRSATILGNNMGYNATDWPSAINIIQNMNLQPNERNRFVLASQREPVELMKYIVNNDKQWTDMVAGNYTVVTALVAQYMQASVLNGATFADPMDDTVFLPATMPNQRLGGKRDMAGVISTQTWLAVNPTTPTNRDRARARYAALQFLATDFAALAERPIVDATVMSFRIPTMENPGCAICHDTVDPMAAGWQNFQENNRERPFTDSTGLAHALPAVYRSNNYPKDANGQSYYKPGHAWFADQKAPGYNGQLMPGGITGNPTALGWLGQQMANDPRFAVGAVNFWAKAVLGRAMIKPPLDTSTPENANRMSAYNAQNEVFQDIANRFRTNRGNGAYNVKDLLADLVMSPWARAEATSVALTPAREIELAELGSFNMLPTTHLNRKITAVIGQAVPEFNNPNQGFGLNYGDFDEINRKVRAQEHTMMQTITLDRITAVRSCGWVQNAFSMPQATRPIVRMVTLADTPATAAGQQAIQNNLVFMAKTFWNKEVSASDPEIQRAYQLYTDIWNDRGTASPQTVTCAYNNTNDANYTGRTWAAMVAYFVISKDFVYN